MALVKKPPETISRTLKLDRPVSELLDEYCRFVDCTPDYVTNFLLRKTLAQDAEFRRWKAARNGAARRGEAGNAA
jgi:hypothetical protein